MPSSTPVLPSQAVDGQTLKNLKLLPTGTAPIATTHGVAMQYTYACSISFPDTPLGTLDFSTVVAGELATLGYIALIGCDVLRYCQLVYNGPEGFWTLAY